MSSENKLAQWLVRNAKQYNVSGSDSKQWICLSKPWVVFVINSRDSSWIIYDKDVPYTMTDSKETLDRLMSLVGTS